MILVGRQGLLANGSTKQIPTLASQQAWAAIFEANPDRATILKLKPRAFHNADATETSLSLVHHIFRSYLLQHVIRNMGPLRRWH